MEALRGRNRQLEAQQRKQRAADEEAEAKMQPKLRKQAHQLKVLTDLLKLPPEMSPGIGEAGLARSGPCSTAASLTTAESTSTWPSTSVSDAGVSPPLSQVAAHAVGNKPP